MFSSQGNDRFSGRGRGRAGYASTSRGGQGWRPTQVIPRTPSPPLGPVLTKILDHELNGDDILLSKAKITNVQDIASYNWIKANEPTIIVPGMPPKWTPTASSTRLAEDNPDGTYYRDPNAAYFPSYPMEPVVRSIFESHIEHDFDPTTIDIFGCGSTLGNLLRFVRNVETEKPFRFLVEVVGNTVFFIRRENSPKEVIHDVRGFGHSFPEANTTWDANVQGSETHQRIIRYQLGDVNVAIRFEADGYLADKVQGHAKASIARHHGVDEDSLVSALAGSTIDAMKHSDSNSLNLIQGSRYVPQSAVFDLKTRTIKKKYNDTTLSDQIPRLWIRQIPSFILAYHERGVFRSNEVTVHDVKPDVIRWETDNRRDVRKLIALINKISNFVKTTPEQKLEVQYKDGVGLELRKQDAGVTPVLPEDLAARWADKEAKFGSDDGGVDLGDESNGEFGLDDGPDDDLRGWDSESEKDFTACSAEDCGYCGHCSY
ncbi:hypothetical protein EG327_006903 [Venturia inaequalis]|uniref:Geranylgeranyl pyrophosphate synthetase n=1 Tax=Venturia inaequalis TaxID=5025 RepID=A0A8H3V1L1_VENIN|nr:hypothetical protein EG327_006903 [Venturia inaequalis]